MAGLFERIKNLLGGVDSEESDLEKSQRLDRKIAERQIAEVIALENAYAERDEYPDSEILEVISFQVRAPEGEDEEAENGLFPWINIEDRTAEFNRLIDPDELVLPYSRVVVLVDYPLANPARRKIDTDGPGFTRRDLVDLIGKTYEEIYEEEEASATVKTVPLDERKILNRNQTDGIHGIWGHDLADIALSGIEVRSENSGGILLVLDIES